MFGENIEFCLTEIHNLENMTSKQFATKFQAIENKYMCK